MNLVKTILLEGFFFLMFIILLILGIYSSDLYVIISSLILLWLSGYIIGNYQGD